MEDTEDDIQNEAWVHLSPVRYDGTVGVRKKDQPRTPRLAQGDHSALWGSDSRGYSVLTHHDLLLAVFLEEREEEEEALVTGAHHVSLVSRCAQTGNRARGVDEGEWSKSGSTHTHTHTAERERERGGGNKQNTERNSRQCTLPKPTWPVHL